jgi:transcriptional regulator with XRE-family HTH domain
MEEPISRRVAANLRRIRNARGWSAATLAIMCRDFDYPALDRSVISKIESDKEQRRVTVDELAALATVLDVSVADLLRAPEDWPPEERGYASEDVDGWLRGFQPSFEELLKLRDRASEMSKAIERMVRYSVAARAEEQPPSELAARSARKKGRG